MKLHFTVASLAGLVRENNEDMALLVGAFYRDVTDELPQVTLSPESRFCAVVADGMGGYEGGEVASEMALRLLGAFIAAQPDDVDVDGLISKLKTYWLADVTAAMLEAAAADSRLASMGTTLTGFIFIGGRVLLVNVGDSRVYRLRDGFLKQMTIDHSLRQLTGDMSQPSNVIYNAIGLQESFIDVSDVTARIAPGDRYVICSDGLCDMLDDDEIAAVASAPAPASDIASAACRAGGADNVTVVTVDVEA
ncbi:MAG: PP2C family protein-serine/threonine phosphatase [Muribaculaceae bacterium]